MTGLERLHRLVNDGNPLCLYVILWRDDLKKICDSISRQIKAAPNRPGKRTQRHPRKIQERSR